MFKTSKNKGFTLLELMVALTIFIVVSIIAVSIFVTAVQNQRRQFLVQNLQDNARFILELISKEIRMNRGIETGTASELKILDQDGDRVRYKFENIGGLNSLTRIEKKNDGGGAPQIGNGEQGSPLNSSQINIEGKFYVVFGSATQQPKVTINMLLTPSGASQPQVRVQNTVTSRQY